MALCTLLIARRLGEVGLGEYAFVASVIFLANVLTTFGVDMLLIREIAAGEGLAHLPAALLIQLGLSTLFVGLTFFGAPLLPGQSHEVVLALQIYSLALFPLAFFTIFTAALRGKEQMGGYAALNLATSFLQFAALWLFIQPDNNIVTVALLLLVTQFAAALLAGLICGLQIPELLHGWRFSTAALSTLVRLSAPIALLGLLGMLYQKLSIYLLATFAGAAMTGWFSAALRIVEAFKTGHLALFGALYPAMARRAAGQRSDIFIVPWQVLIATAVAIALALFFLAPPLVPLLYGSGFEASISALKILAWLLIPYTINTYLSLACLAQGQEKRVAFALCGSLITLAVFNAWWIPRFALAGACWAALVAEVAQAALLLFQQYQVKRTL